MRWGFLGCCLLVMGGCAARSAQGGRLSPQEPRAPIRAIRFTLDAPDSLLLCVQSPVGLDHCLTLGVLRAHLVESRVARQD